MDCLDTLLQMDSLDALQARIESSHNLQVRTVANDIDLLQVRLVTGVPASGMTPYSTGGHTRSLLLSFQP